jgi:hypothetical protein
MERRTYQRSYKHMAAQGWLRGEPEEIPDEQPEIVLLSLRQLEKHMNATPLDVCKALRWTAGTFRAVTGVAVPDYQPPAADDNGIVQLALIRAQRATGGRPKRRT